MKINKIINTVIFTLGMAMCSVSQAFVGSIAVGLGQMNDDVGQIETAFSADAKLETEDMTTMTHISYKPGKVRDEINMNGEQMVTIHRFDLNKVWMLMGSQNMYMEVDPERGSKQAPQYKLISREKIGPEVVNGILTTKYKSIYESADGKFGGFTWFTKDNIAVKAFMVQKTNGEKHRIKYEFQNLKRGDQADSQFEIPAGYRKFQMGGMGSIPGMQGMGQNMGQGMDQGMGQAMGNAPAAPPAAPASAPASGSASSGDEGGFAAEMADEAQKTAEDTAKDETKRSIRDTIRKGFGSLFGR
jgi:hypothetical protein